MYQHCHPTAGRAVAVIEHPPREETLWDWVELPNRPPPGVPGERACQVDCVSSRLILTGQDSANLQQSPASEVTHKAEGPDHSLRRFISH